MIRCPLCHSKTKTIETRGQTTSLVKRRKECVECGYRFNTFEEAEKNVTGNKAQDGIISVTAF